MTEERIRIGEDYYLLASALAPRRPQILLNHADSFAIFDIAGDLPVASREPFGLFYQGCRFLNRFELHLNGGFPLLLGTAPPQEGSELVTYLSNTDEQRGGTIILARDTVSMRRHKTLYESTLYESLQLRTYSLEPLQIELEFVFAADFVDIFELRGTERVRRGEVAAPRVGRQEVCVSYQGLDNVRRETTLVFSQVPYRLTDLSAHFRLTLSPGEETVLDTRVVCQVGDMPRVSYSFASALEAVRNERSHWRDQCTALYSNNEGFNDWLNRSLQDLALLRTAGEAGSYVYAGIPWFATVFGRDGLVTAFETLAFAPDLAVGTLRTLAALQGQEDKAERDEEPGKILHEMRYGEMAATGEIPFRRYYGSIDATPLFLLLFAAYADRTGDVAFVEELWPAAVAAMHWMETSADIDGDGYVKYKRRTTRGLVNQGWKDSHDAISHMDGTLSEPPIVLAEVQAYVYAALRGMARVARRLERPVEAATWDARALQLQERFNLDFWLADEGIFALALDKDKRPCRVVSSNAGHCLFGGIAEPKQAPQVVARLMRDDMFCGWGIRTLSSQARRYNPMSYHNGSVWPHDNALIAAGFALYGANAHAGQLLTALFDAFLAIGDRRLPELFCGFPRYLHHSPAPYPVACKPQAWAAGSVFLLLQATLGLSIDAWERRITFDRPALPSWLTRLDIRGLRVGDGRVDVSVSRARWGAAVEVIDKQGEIEVVVRK